MDLYHEHKLSELLHELCKMDFTWVRLHYLYPDEITDDMIETIAQEPKIVKYLDIPIQHVNNRILRAMHRRGDAQFLRELFHKLRREIPGLVLRTSLIVGLPGETDEEFEELCDFLREMQIERAGVFCYSPEEGSEALATYDLYPWEYTSFPVDGDVILIKDDRLADALTTLPKRFRDILLMYWFLELADREIGERLSLSRRTVNNRRQQAYDLLRKLMGGDVNE